MHGVTVPPPALAWLHAAASARAAAGLHRTPTSRPAGAGGLLDLAGNDYLGLARHPLVVEAAAAAAREYGAGATGSRAVTGTTDLHLELEAELSRQVRADAALVLSSGYLANLAAVTALSGPGTLVVSDAGNHASIVDACRLSRARVVVVPHGDLGAVERALDDRVEERALLVTDAVFSVSGQLAALPDLHRLARAAGAAFLVDEAHSVGVVGVEGRGAMEVAGLSGEPDVVLTVTLSKALGSQGGAVLGAAAVRAHLVDTARPFLFDTALAPPAAGAALAALRLVDRGRVAALHTRAGELSAAVGAAPTDSAVVPLHVGDPFAAAAARDACRDEGVLVGCFRPPSVPAGQSCLRLTARADLSSEDIGRAGEVVRAAMKEHA
ncbi:MAG: aminotransferase class I/II-fold pyridoxal phosphate-dependent enzyme [Actinobacteria bacterium]|nr:aminotransferase class I/II-fold pyridoxal phosphate-dependent enzyme [Actinomycetota bacterium]